MLHPLKLSIGLASLLLVVPSIALAQSAPSGAPAPPAEAAPRSVTPDRSPVSSPANTEPTPDSVSQDVPEAQAPTCPAGQFASKFPDVTPNDWAYEAVNRIANGAFRCFPLPSLL